MMKLSIRIGIFLTAFVFLAVVVLVAAVLYFENRPLDDSVTATYLQEAAENTDDILVKVGNTYYEVDGTAEFSGLLACSAWQSAEEPSEGESVLVLRLAEAYLVEFFADGSVTAYNGYAAESKAPEAYYEIPAEVPDKLIAYLEAHGTALTLGDGSIGTTTFQK